jgi:DNA-binding MarR family transcriptional regulator
MVEQKSTGSAPADSEDLDLGILLGLAYQSFTDQLRAALAHKGFDDLGGAYGYVFRALAADELSQRELATRLQITDQGMAKILGEMVERGYVERRPDASDARVKRLRLARRGREALAAARRIHAGLEQRLVREVGADGIKALRRVLGQVARLGNDDDVAHARLRPM